MDGRVVLVLHGLILFRRTDKGLCWAEEADVTERIGTPCGRGVRSRAVWSRFAARARKAILALGTGQPPMLTERPLRRHGRGPEAGRARHPAPQTRAELPGDGRREAPVTRKDQTGTRISVT